jgi:hypothetical protein
VFTLDEVTEALLRLNHPEKPFADTDEFGYF